VAFSGREGGAVVLDLFEERRIMGRGFYLGPDADLSLLHEVEVAIDRESFDAVESETGLAELPFPLEDHMVEYLEAPTSRISAYQPDAERRILTGTITLLEDVLTFRGQEYGSPELITIIVVSAWALFCGGNMLHDLIKTCEKKAVETCGAGRVKSVVSKRSWAKLGCGATCKIECFERPATEVAL
jgi:hypothetical protein